MFSGIFVYLNLVIKIEIDGSPPEDYNFALDNHKRS